MISWKKSLDEPGLLIKGVRETTENEAKEQKWGFVRISGFLGARLFVNILTGKDTFRASEGTIRAGENF